MPKKKCDRSNTGRNDPGRARPARDAKGRWLPGHCPNPKGRPKKDSEESTGPVHLLLYGREKIEVLANGKKERMDRQTALLNKMFQTAMKGNPHMQRYLYSEIMKHEEDLAESLSQLIKYHQEWVTDNPDFGKSGYRLPTKVRIAMGALTVLLKKFGYDIFPDIGLFDEDDNEGTDD